MGRARAVRLVGQAARGAVLGVHVEMNEDDDVYDRSHAQRQEDPEIVQIETERLVGRVDPALSWWLADVLASLSL